MGKIYVSKMLLLGAVVMGLMMGISSCCCDDKKSQSPEQVEAQLKSMSSEVKSKSLEVTNKNNELAQLEISKGNGGSVSDDDIAKLKNQLALLTAELQSLNTQLQNYINSVSNNAGVSATTINEAKDIQEGGTKVGTNATTLIVATENYLANPTQENLNTLVQTAKTCLIFKVAFDSQNGSKVDTAYVKSGEKVTKPTDPTWENHTFIAWYTTKNVADTAEKKFNFDGAIVKDTTLFAFWKENGGSKPAVTSISLSKKRDTLALCDTMQLTATILPAEAEQGVTWSSSSTNAKVEGGKVTISKDASTNGEIVLVISQSVADADKKDTCIIKVNTHRMRVPANGRKNTYAVQLWNDNIWWAEFNVGATIESYSSVQNWSGIVSYVSGDDHKAVNLSDATHQELFRYVGNYFNWGATAQHTNDTKGTSKQEDTPLSGADDAATANWGDAWRMPTGGTDSESDLYKLLELGIGDGSVSWQNIGDDGCPILYKGSYKFDGSAIPGVCFKGKGDYANDSIFFPAAGNCSYGLFRSVGSYGLYWSSVHSGDYCAWGLNFGSGDASMYHDYFRYLGHSVRAVCAK